MVWWFVGPWGQLTASLVDLNRASQTVCIGTMFLQYLLRMTAVGLQPVSLACSTGPMMLSSICAVSSISVVECSLTVILIACLL